MTNSFNVTTEQVDDIPVLLMQGKQLGVPDLLDAHFVPHGNWQGTSLGWTTLVWLTHILSEGDHRLNQVQAWVEKRVHTLGVSTGQPVCALEWSDDRLGIVLDELAEDENWRKFETALNRHTFRVYDLRPQRVRVDSTTVSGHWTVTEDGLFQFGHSKDHRPDLPQVKGMLSALDPLGLPVATQVVSGERADDPLYIPAVQQVRASLDTPGLLYVGDCKMAALATRAFLQHGWDYYLCPLAATQLPEATRQAYLQPVWEGQQALQAVMRENREGQPEKIAEGYEQTVTLHAAGQGETLPWTERRLIVRSLQAAQAAEAALRAHLGKAQATLQKLNEPKPGKARPETAAQLQTAAEQVLQHSRVMGLLQVNITEQHTERQIRTYGDRPARTKVQTTLTLQAEIDEPAVQEVVREFGWRVYATNQPQETRSLAQAVLAYREEYLVERGFGRLKGKPLSISPMYLQRDTRATGLVRLLTLGVRMLTLLEYRVRQRLADLHDKLSGLYAGNPKRTTEHPTAEAMLRAFKGLYVSVVTLGEQVWYHVTPLSEVQGKILACLDFSVDIYTQLTSGFPKPAGKMTEP